MPESPSTGMAAAPQDRFLGGRLLLRQPARGYRAGLDAALLAAAVSVPEGQRALEAGCGVGAALLQAAARSPGARFVGVERDVAAVELSAGNITDNGLAERVEVVCADVQTPFSKLGLSVFDSAFANPPFFDDENALRAPDPERRDAWIADGGLQAWTQFLLKAVREGGVITLVHRADRLADILALLAPKAGSFRIRPVHPFADAPAKRVLVRAIKTGRAPMLLLPPLVLRDRGETSHRPEVEAIFRGEAALGWED